MFKMHSLISTVLALLVLLPLVLAEAPDKAKAQASIPMAFRVSCGNPDTGRWLTPDCDGRTEYCDKAGVLRCGPCERICRADQSTFQCQQACKMYLDFNEKTARDQTLDAKLDALDARGENSRSGMQNQLDKISFRADVLSVCVALIALVLFFTLALLIYIAWNIKEHNRAQYGPLTQTSDADKKVDQESGFGTRTNSADSLRRNDPAGNGAETTPRSNALVQPTDAIV